MYCFPARTLCSSTLNCLPRAHAHQITKHENVTKPKQDLFTIFDNIDKAADKVEGAFGAIAGAAGKVGSALNAVTPVVKPLAERVASAAAPIEEAAVKYAERTILPVVTQAEKAVEGVAVQAFTSAEDAIKAQVGWILGDHCEILLLSHVRRFSCKLNPDVQRTAFDQTHELCAMFFTTRTFR